MSNVAVILAAGSGLRAGGGIPKQYQLLGRRPLLRHTLEAFCGHVAIDTVQVVIAEGEEQRFLDASVGLRVLPPVTGGLTRQESGYRGLAALRESSAENVLIHDAARPFVSAALIADVVSALENNTAVIPALRVAETLKYAPGGIVNSTVDRTDLWSAQTPQGFRYISILQAHEAARSKGLTSFTDDASIAEWAGISVAVIAGEGENIKITSSEDFAKANEKLNRADYLRCPDVRSGLGYDVHGFEEGDHVVLCGVKIPHTAKLKGHSDADVALHALTDAILGAIGESDIGTHFPPTDEQWRGADSSIFLAHACKLLSDRKGFISNADITIICETPKIGPHIEEMRRRLQSMLKLASDRISIKATTSEGLGFLGRKEGIAAYASVTVRLP